ncbi:unnamed protein product [Cylindrotheca closterium]|uniref:SET domain-containing protein n=1 Tax=Cylindrotheca closterium TaxID=2856 RepID=A0AAD2FWD2_9STRA|nr:unnamed protein product [Cylindrotheca closterium]
MSANDPINLADTSSSEEEDNFGDSCTTENEANIYIKGDNGTDATDTKTAKAELQAAKSSDGGEIFREDSGTKLPQRVNIPERASLTQSNDIPPSEETRKKPKLVHNTLVKHDDDGNAFVADNVGSRNTNDNGDSNDDEIVWLGSRASVPKPDKVVPIAELKNSLEGLTRAQVFERMKNDPRIQQTLDSPIAESTEKGRSMEDTIDISDGSSIISVHSLVDVDARVNPEFDDVSVIEMSSSEEEDSDDDEAPFMGDTSFMMTNEQSKVRDELVVEETPELLEEAPTRPRVSIREMAETFKKDHDSKEDEKILVVVEEAVRKVHSKRKQTLRRKAKRFQRKTRVTVVAETQENIKKFPTQSSEKPCLIRGEYLDDPNHPLPKCQVTFIPIKKSTGCFDKHPTELLDVCYDFECMGWLDYKEGLQEQRMIPRYIIERRIKEAEEVVSRVCKRLGTSGELPKVAQSYIATLMNLSAKSIFHIWCQQLKKKATSGPKCVVQLICQDVNSDNLLASLGCQCKSKCLTPNCPCHRAGRECNPDLCKTCQTCTDPAGIPKERKQKCRNDNIRMHRQNKGLFYGKSTIPKAGWGLFCKTEIKRGEFIGEYVGEVINEDEINRRTATGENLDYLFDLGNGHCVDGLRQGNFTRFMNHSHENQNVRAAIMKVDGGPRIAFFARSRIIPAETELFFDYGKRYKTDFSTGATSRSRP